MIVRSDRVEFCWSCRRRRWWKRCRRAYFLYYYAAEGGHDPDAEAVCREAHRRKSLLSLDALMAALLRKSIRELFYADAERRPGPGALTALAESRFEAQFGNLLFDRHRGDHAVFQLTDACLGKLCAGKLHDELAKKLHTACQTLEAGDWSELLNLPAERHRAIASPLFIQVGELKCAAVPLLAATAPGGAVWIIEGLGATYSEEEDAATAFLHKFHAVNFWRRDPARVRSFALNWQNGRLTERGADCDIGATLRSISADCSAMLDKIRPDGTVNSADFPMNRDGCADCPFSGFCE